MRKKIIAGNWKMNMTPKNAKNLCKQLIPLIKNDKQDTIIFCVPYVDLEVVKNSIKNTNIKLGAQNFYFEDKGAFTGEISADMLKEIGVEYVIIGHSERRQIFKENDNMINKKITKAIEKNITPIICCGETLKQREEKQTLPFIEKQIINAFKNVNIDNAKNCIVAYEPIWAIGTGKTATSKQAEEVCSFIRKTISKIYDKQTSEEIHILYGGSVNEKNAKELFSQKNIDGGLVGGASLKIEFANIK